MVKIAEETAFQTDLRAGERLFWLTDIGWIMGPWEIVGTLASRGTLVMYDGAPDFPGPDRLWDLVERHRINVLGVSPTLIRAPPTADGSRRLQPLRASAASGSSGSKCADGAAADPVDSGCRGC